MDETLNERAGEDTTHPLRVGANAEPGDAAQPLGAKNTRAAPRPAESSPASNAEGGGAEARPPLGWSAVAAMCLIVAVPCLLIGQMSAAFVIATVGVVAWFLNVRSQLKRAHPEMDGGHIDGDEDESEDGSESDKDYERRA